jgi:pimeloyl-ACP methyl ester carboxylesterase
MDTGGTGVPVILVHGLANSIEIWSRVLPALARGHRVIAFDLPGFGQADRPRQAAYDTRFFGAQLEALFDTLGLSRANVVGSSLGASVAVRFAAENLERVDRLVLAAPGGFGRQTNLLMRAPALPLIGSWLGRPTARNNRLTLRLAIHDRRQITRELVAITNEYARMPGSDRSFVRTLQSGVSLLGSTSAREMGSLAPLVKSPALILWGKQDRVFPARYAARAAALLPHSRVRLIDACGHYPHWEQPNIFIDAVEEFLA